MKSKYHLYNVPAFLFLLLIGPFLSGQTVVEEITYNQDFKADSTDCETLETKLSAITRAQNKIVHVMHSKADSLSKLEYPCYEYWVEIVDEMPYTQDSSVITISCGSRGYLAYQAYQKFTVHIIKDRRFNLFYPMYSGKVFCGSDFYRP